ncbi:MAG: hypothetical protein ACRC8S_00290 [Fimbriiglobus sp.]
MRNWLLLFLLLLVVSGVGAGALIAYQEVFEYHEPGGRVSVWKLKDGTQVRFFMVPRDGKDTRKVLEITHPGQAAVEHPFATTQGGFRYVELRADANENMIWIIDTSRKRVGCTYNLETQRFVDVGGSHPLPFGTDIGHVVGK